jgi:hypothetical protein
MMTVSNWVLIRAGFGTPVPRSSCNGVHRDASSRFLLTP